LVIPFTSATYSATALVKMYGVNAKKKMKNHDPYDVVLKSSLCHVVEQKDLL